MPQILEKPPITLLQNASRPLVTGFPEQTQELALLLKQPIALVERGKETLFHNIEKRFGTWIPAYQVIQ
jgi:hypothetical protein